MTGLLLSLATKEFDDAGIAVAEAGCEFAADADRAETWKKFGL